MKKNNMFRIASVLLVAVLLSTCAISGAFAKYTTGEVEAADQTARVAKFGITLAAAAAENAAFSTEYEAHDNETQIDLTVEAGVPVVAPGTTGSLANVFALAETYTLTDPDDLDSEKKYDREVAVKVEYTATVDFDANWIVGQDEYCPIVITFDSVDYYVGKTDIDDIADLESAIADAIAAKSAEYEVGERIANLPALTWTWAFDGTAEGVLADQDDTRDTALGLAGGANITISLTATVSQID